MKTRVAPLRPGQDALHQIGGGEQAELTFLLAVEGIVDGAAEALARSAAERPGDFDARMLLAEALARAGRLEEALGEIEACLRIRPGDPEASRARAAMASALGR